MNAVLEAAPRALAHAAGLDLDAYREEHVEERIARAVARENVASVGGLVRLVASPRRTLKRAERTPNRGRLDADSGDFANELRPRR